MDGSASASNTAAARQWNARLEVGVARRAGRSVAVHRRHSGPLRLQKALYPEGPDVAHLLVVHPPAGIAGGDRLEIEIAAADSSNALVTTPGATRFYRSTGATATQRLHASLADAARLEWLPLETIAFSGCLGENLMRFALAPGAEMIGWDVLALGLPAADQAFARGRFTQCVELPGRWLERGRIDALDACLLDSPLGWAGHRVLGTMWFAAGSALPTERREALLGAARGVVDGDPLQRSAGATAVHDGIVVLRVLTPRVEPAMALLGRVWAAWRNIAWQLEATPPRVWRT